MESIDGAEAESAEGEARFNTCVKFVVLGGLEALVVHIRTQVLTGVVEFVGGVDIVNLGAFVVGPVVVATTETESEHESGQVDFKTADVMFFHAGGVVGRVIVVVVGHKCTFGVCQVTGLDGEEFCRLVLDVGSVVDGGRIRGFVVGFKAYEG